MKITKMEVHTEAPDGLPADAVRWGHTERLVQDIKITTEVVLHQVWRWRGPSEGKTYAAKTGDLSSGGFGHNLQSFIMVLHHLCDMTQGKIETLLSSVGLSVSSGTISAIVNGSKEWAKDERSELFKAGVALSPYVQTDSTQSKESGKSLKTHIFGSDAFTAFYTSAGKSGLEILNILQDEPEGGLDLSHNRESERLLSSSAVSDKHLPAIASLFENRSAIKLSDFEPLLKIQYPELAKKPTVVKRVAESLATGHYFTQTDTPVVDYPLSDNAPEYGTLARVAHAPCWVRDARNYNRLVATL